MGLIIGDSAYALSEYPTEWNGLPIVGWGFYIGGNTPHVWTAAEVALLKAAPHIRYLIPIFTRSVPGDAAQGQSDAAWALEAMQQLGQPKGTIVQLDYESAVDAAYEVAFDATVRADGYLMELYGSASTVVKNPEPSGGYDEAAWTGRDYAPTSTGDQFTDTGPFDLNDFRTDAPLWDLHPAPIAQEETVKLYAAPRSNAPGAVKDVFVFGNGQYTHVSDPTIYKDLVGLGWEPQEINYPTHAWLLATWGGTPVTA